MSAIDNDLRHNSALGVKNGHCSASFSIMEASHCIVQMGCSSSASLNSLVHFVVAGLSMTDRNLNAQLGGRPNEICSSWQLWRYGPNFDGSLRRSVVPMQTLYCRRRMPNILVKMSTACLDIYARTFYMRTENCSSTATFFYRHSYCC